MLQFNILQYYNYNLLLVTNVLLFRKIIIISNLIMELFYLNKPFSRAIFINYKISRTLSKFNVWQWLHSHIALHRNIYRGLVNFNIILRRRLCIYYILRYCTCSNVNYMQVRSLAWCKYDIQCRCLLALMHTSNRKLIEELWG